MEKIIIMKKNREYNKFCVQTDLKALLDGHEGRCLFAVKTILVNQLSFCDFFVVERVNVVVVGRAVSPWNKEIIVLLM